MNGRRHATQSEREFDDRVKAIIRAGLQGLTENFSSDQPGLDIGEWSRRGSFTVEGAGEQAIMGYRIHIWPRILKERDNEGGRSTDS